MAITLIVEDGSVVEDANAYLDRDAATTILEIDHRVFPIWDGLTDEVQDQLLVFATAWLDENYQWFGIRADTDTPQALQWPRKGMKDRDELCLAETVIPEDIKKATAFLAVWLYTNDPDELITGGGIKRFRHDTTEIEWQDGWQGFAQPPFLKRYLDQYGYGPGQHGAKKIIRK